MNLEKNIPMGGGLGGGSSNAAVFLKMINEEANLKINSQNLLQIGTKIGADVPFFLSEFKAANVAGIGEKIAEFDDEVPNFKLVLKNISCDTAKVYGEFRANFMLSFCTTSVMRYRAEIYDNKEPTGYFIEFDVIKK